MITFRESNGAIVTHRAIRIGKTAVRTKGDANKTPDVNKVPKDHVIGPVVASVPKAGWIVAFVHQSTGLASLLLLALAVPPRRRRRVPEAQLATAVTDVPQGQSPPVLPSRS